MEAKEISWIQAVVEILPERSVCQAKIPEYSIPEIFNEATAKYSRKPALIFYGREITYAELREHVDRFATALADLGVKKGDVVRYIF